MPHLRLNINVNGGGQKRDLLGLFFHNGEGLLIPLHNSPLHIQRVETSFVQPRGGPSTSVARPTVGDNCFIFHCFELFDPSRKLLQRYEQRIWEMAGPTPKFLESPHIEQDNIWVSLDHLSNLLHSYAANFI